MNADRWRWLRWLPPTIYSLSMVLPAARSVLIGSDTLYFGYEAFQVGVRALTLDTDFWDLERIELSLAWLANPAMWVSFACLAIGRRRTAIAAGSAGCLLCLSVLPTWASLVVSWPAYWLWWGSAVSSLLMAMFMLPRQSLHQADDYRLLSGP